MCGRPDSRLSYGMGGSKIKSTFKCLKKPEAGKVQTLTGKLVRLAVRSYSATNGREKLQDGLTL